MAGRRLLAVAHHSHIGLDNLVNLSLVNIQVDNLSLRSILRRHACDTVAETHTDGDEHITLLGLHVGSIRTMHTEHTHVERVVARQGRKAEQGSDRQGYQPSRGIRSVHYVHRQVLLHDPRGRMVSWPC